ncbi:hypothetical protein IKN40_00595 [bacterium]|nr:hypothetical protein [bacterium]
MEELSIAPYPKYVLLLLINKFHHIFVFVFIIQDSHVKISQEIFTSHDMLLCHIKLSLTLILFQKIFAFHFIDSCPNAHQYAFILFHDITRFSHILQLYKVLFDISIFHHFTIIDHSTIGLNNADQFPLILFHDIIISFHTCEYRKLPFVISKFHHFIVIDHPIIGKLLLSLHQNDQFVHV